MHIDAHHVLGRALQALQRTSEAESAYGKAVLLELSAESATGAAEADPL